jgi:hypothetical protein
LVIDIMKQAVVPAAEILVGYNPISRLYPYIPSMIIWSARGYAACRHSSLSEPVFDVCCDSGGFLRLASPSPRGTEYDKVNVAVKKK